MKLTELEPKWLSITSPKSFRHSSRARMPKGTDGIIFLCPKCFSERGRIGTHSIICWRPHVPQTMDPVPGRWEFEGRTFNTLTLVAGSSSILLTTGCAAHFFIQKGKIVW
jgi:hypothetical protein